MSSASFPERGLRIQNINGKRLIDIFNIPISTIVGLGLIFFVSWVNLAALSVDKDSVGIDTQVLVKLMGIALAGIYGAIGFCTDRRVRDIIQSFPVFWMVIIIVLYFVAAPFSLTKMISFASAVSMVAVLLMTITALVQIGVMPVLNAIFAGMAFFNIFSWIVYFVWPEVGVLAEPLPEGKFAYRMSGLAHANTLGQCTGLTVVLGSIMYFTYQKRSALRVGLIFIALAALINSLSRTSLVATIVALAVAYRHVFLKPEYITRYIVIGFLGTLGILLVSTQVDIGAKIQEKLTIVSKSGDAEELTTATGRAEIWAYTIRLIKQKPLIGYGAATSKYYLADYSQYTHNMVLNVAFSTGIVGGFAMLMMIFGRIRAMTTVSHPLADGILMFIIVNGLFENVIFSILCGMPTIVWIVSLCWPLLKDDPMLDTQTGALKSSTSKIDGKLRFSQ